jgi:predicted MPP superfamily phosphohydrolase
MKEHLDLVPYLFSPPAIAGVGAFLLLLSTLAARSWVRFDSRVQSKIAIHRNVFFLMLGMGLADGLALALLPVLGLSFGRIEVAWVLITLVRQAAFGLVGLGWSVARWLRRGQPQTGKLDMPSQRLEQRFAWRVLLGLQVLILAIELQGLYHEPFRLGTTTLEVNLPLTLEERPLRLLQITDLHLERITMRERAVLAEVERLQPDIILLTGDYVNLDYRSDPQTWAETRQFLSQLEAPLGIFAVTGTPGVDIPQAVHAIFDDQVQIRLLQDDLVRLELPGSQVLAIAGITNLGSRDVQAFEQVASQIEEAENALLLYHTPDLAPLAAASGKIDLYLAGHTHGGQVRVPFFGALVTFSAYGLTYQMGRYDLEEMTLYVSRGLGMEGYAMPRARFLCPPELVFVEFRMR